jgi:hypothetical protein
VFLERALVYSRLHIPLVFLDYKHFKEVMDSEKALKAVLARLCGTANFVLSVCLQTEVPAGFDHFCS